MVFLFTVFLYVFSIIHYLQKEFNFMESAQFQCAPQPNLLILFPWKN